MNFLTKSFTKMYFYCLKIIKMKHAAFLLLILAAAFSCNDSKSDKKEDGKKDNYEKAKETLLETEKKDPTRFITVSGHDKKNLIGQTVIRGTLNSHAKEATFKDVDLDLAFYSKTGALLEKDRETIFDILAPGESVNFKTKYFAPKGTDSLAIVVVGAKAE